MRIYTVQVRPGGPPDEPDVALIKEGFCWPALFVPLPWLIWHRLWLGLGGYIVAWLLLDAAATWLQLGDLSQTALGLGLSVLIAAEANDWRRRTLARQGFRFAGVVVADNMIAAERRVFANWPPQYLRMETP